jgi:hypothetical protein
MTDKRFYKCECCCKIILYKNREKHNNSKKHNFLFDLKFYSIRSNNYIDELVKHIKKLREEKDKIIKPPDGIIE